MLLFCLSELNNNIYFDCLTVGLVVAFTDGGWSANLHGLHLVCDLILFCFSGLFLVFGHLSFVFFNGFWILSALFIHQLGLHLGILSVYLGSPSFVSFIPAMLQVKCTVRGIKPPS